MYLINIEDTFLTKDVNVFDVEASIRVKASDLRKLLKDYVLRRLVRGKTSAKNCSFCK